MVDHTAIIHRLPQKQQPDYNLIPITCKIPIGDHNESKKKNVCTETNG